jgi:hypothetical protein
VTITNQIAKLRALIDALETRLATLETLQQAVKRHQHLKDDDHARVGPGVTH